jgi:hypothetical protein
MPNPPLSYLSVAGAGLYVDRLAVDLPNVANGATVDHDIALPAGSTLGGDQNIVLEARPVPDLARGLVIDAAWVPAADTLRVRLSNFSAAPINPAAGTLRVAILKVA